MSNRSSSSLHIIGTPIHWSHWLTSRCDAEFIGQILSTRSPDYCLGQVVCCAAGNTGSQIVLLLARLILNCVCVPATAFSPFLLITSSICISGKSRVAITSQRSEHGGRTFNITSFIFERLGPDELWPVTTLRRSSSWLVWCGQGREEQLGEVYFILPTEHINNRFNGRSR